MTGKKTTTTTTSTPTTTRRAATAYGNLGKNCCVYSMEEKKHFSHTFIILVFCPSICTPSLLVTPMCMYKGVCVSGQGENRRNRQKRVSARILVGWQRFRRMLYAMRTVAAVPKRPSKLFKPWKKISWIIGWDTGSTRTKIYFSCFLMAKLKIKK